MSQFLDKYNRPVPRYTSYPPANFFSDQVSEEDYLEHIDNSNTEEPSLLSFYIHFPYCHHLCYYCGCNSYVRSSVEDDDVYFDALLREIDIVIAHISSNRQISQIHFGGGSPSLADPKLLGRVIDRLTSKFSLIDQPEIAIECHPGYLTREGYEALLSLGFTRISLGVQDFNTEVLKAVNRKEPLLAIEEVQEIMSRHSIPLNLDFIYGLPLQSAKSFKDTIGRAIELKPSRLVTFSYAHVPSMFTAQKILERRGLPSAEEKGAMFRVAQEKLLESGYLQIGLDHFVLSSDELHQAALSHQLHRNFQGYCTRRTTGQVYAFGVSAISQLTTAYMQNTKDIPTYIERVNEGHLPIMRGLIMTPQQRIVREVINMLMCNEQISWREIAQSLRLTPEEVKKATHYCEEKMSEMATDGLIHITNDGIQMASKGSPFLRYVAACFDPLQSESGYAYSKPV